MSVNARVLEAFLGKGLVKLRLKDTLFNAIIDFGEIRLPIDAIRKDIDLAEAEKTFRAKIKVYSQFLVITPGFVIEQGYLCSAHEDHLRMLKTWLAEYGVGLIRGLLRG
jgi:hypothetical protein